MRRAAREERRARRAVRCHNARRPPDSLGHRGRLPHPGSNSRMRSPRPASDRASGSTSACKPMPRARSASTASARRTLGQRRTQPPRLVSSSDCLLSGTPGERASARLWAVARRRRGSARSAGGGDRSGVKARVRAVGTPPSPPTRMLASPRRHRQMTPPPPSFAAVVTSATLSPPRPHPSPVERMQEFGHSCLRAEAPPFFSQPVLGKA